MTRFEQPPARDEREREARVRETMELPLKGEDILLVDPEICVAVIDGVTGHNGGKLSFGGESMSYGRWAAEIGRVALLEAARIECAPEQRAERIVAHLAERLDQALATMVVDEAPSFVFAAYFPRYDLLVRVGDCSVLIDGAEVPEVPNVPMHAEERKMSMRNRLMRPYLEAEPPLAPEDIAAARTHVHQATREWQWKQKNSETMFGYSAIDGSYVPPSLIGWKVIPPGTHTITLATDGVRRDALADTWQKTRENLGPGWQQDDDVTYVTLTAEVVS